MVPAAVSDGASGIVPAMPANLHPGIWSSATTAAAKMQRVVHATDCVGRCWDRRPMADRGSALVRAPQRHKPRAPVEPADYAVWNTERIQ